MGQEVPTSMDQLVEMLDRSGAIKIVDAAKELGVDKDHVEGWAKMLEKEDVTKIHYSIVGGAIIRKGPNFDSFMKRLPGKRAMQPAKSTEPQKEAKKPAEAKPSKEEAKPAGDYALIRKQIEDEEVTIEQDLKNLHEEQARIVQYMNSLIGEGNKLVEYIGALRQVMDSAKSERGKKLGELDDSRQS